MIPVYLNHAVTAKETDMPYGKGSKKPMKKKVRKPPPKGK